MEELFLVLRDKSRDPDMDVKIIVRGDFDPTEILNKLQFWRFRMDRVRLLRGVHTKGIIVDDEMVLIGSHNWTSEGTTLNRDASVVFRDADIIRYYNGLFEYDWSRADDRLDDNRGPSLAVAGAPTPPGFVRVPWSSVFED
jgi:phosphatidylserine/phosphatidylglycerophosphate/cardiolipin synthase-like enzyme